MFNNFKKQKSNKFIIIKEKFGMRVGIFGEFTLRVYIIMINTNMKINSHLNMVCSQLFKLFITKSVGM